ncbi:TPA: NACHT domain-containing NTPase [Streptococcus suis]
MVVIKSLIENLLMEELGDYFRGFLGKIKLKFFIKRLKNDVEISILKQYGDRIYYLDFDRFLIEQDALAKIIKNFLNQDTLQSKTINQLVDYYLNWFTEKYPKYKLHNSDLKQILQKYFEIIFKQLNKIKTPESQALCRIIREIIDDIDRRLKYLSAIVDDNNAMLKQVVNGNFRIHSYIKTLLATSGDSFVQSDYFERCLFQDIEDNKEKDSLDILLQHHKVVLKGEAGFGKTFETFKLINQLCAKYSSYQLIPVYVPLIEYEDSLGTLFEIIQSKMEPFCEGNSKEAINQLFVNNRLALFFDGIDDIVDERKRLKFFSEANQLMTQYNQNLFFFTTRDNRYKHELGEDNSFELTPLTDNIIQNDLIRLGRNNNLPKAYRELFRNPLLYKIGKTILADRQNEELFNRTQIFTEYFEKNYRYKNNYSELYLHETLNLFGKFSYEHFEQSSFTYSEVDKIISAYSVSTPNKRNIIDYFINFGIFSTSDRITFSHKLFKEFCAAYYITNNLTVSSDTELLEKLIYNEEWREVVIFISGLFSTIEEQDKFLDFVLQHNLPLYIECVNSKNDLLKNNGLTDFSIENHVERILSEIHKTYTFIVENYFHPISIQFEPFITENQVESKIGITGSIVDNSLYYWFDIVDKAAPDVKIVSSDLLSQASQEYRNNIFLKTTRMIQRSINLELSGLVGDSGRKIALDLIKSNLKDILENKRLIPSNYILCEFLKEIKNKLPWLKEINDISLMSIEVRKKIDETLKDFPEVSGVTTSEGIELFSLNSLLDILLNSGINFKSSIIPSRDKDYSESDGLMLNLYSTKRKIEIVETFFNFAEASYLEMVKYNFPKIYRHFSKNQDMPYKLLVTYKDDERNPWIGYYHVAYSGDKNLIEVSLGDSSKDYEKVYEEILQSYHSLNRVPKDVSWHGSAFSTLLFSFNSRENTPLSDFVHKEIKNSLEKIFGEI